MSDYKRLFNLKKTQIFLLKQKFDECADQNLQMTNVNANVFVRVVSLFQKKLFNRPIHSYNLRIKILICFMFRIVYLCILND